MTPAPGSDGARHAGRRSRRATDGLTPAQLERMILDRLYFQSRFRNVDDSAAEATWNSGLDGTLTYLDPLADELFREVRERHREDDLVELVNRYQGMLRSVLRSLLKRKAVNAFTDGYTIFPRIGVPLPNAWSSKRPRQRIRGLTLTTRGFHEARRIYGSRYEL